MSRQNTITCDRGPCPERADVSTITVNDPPRGWVRIQHAGEQYDLCPGCAAHTAELKRALDGRMSAWLDGLDIETALEGLGVGVTGADEVARG